MVYYPSTPLIVKTEQSSHVQYCSPLQLTASSTTPDVTLQSYNLSSNTIGASSMANASHVNTPTSINNLNANSQYLTSIKSELLPPSISLYATSNVSSTNVNNLVTSNNSAGVSNTSVTTGPHHLESSTMATSTRRKATNGTKPQFKCEQCGMTFNSKSAHTSHTKSHAKNGDFGLNSTLGGQNTNAIEVNEAGIPLGIPKTPLIKPNTSSMPGGDPYECNVCHKTFAVPARLIRHYRTHTGERPFECEFCHKLFSVKENLQVHRRIHTKERPYKCDVCGRAFEHSGKLHRHMRIHTGERPHKCSVCEKTFIQSGQLVIHMRTHTGEKPYKCPVEGCGKGFTCSKQLKVHSRTHTGEKPYHCDICFRDFGYNHVLKLHRVQHYGSKCYKCTICDETFKSKKEMEAHIKGHANEMPEDDEEAAAEGIDKTNSGSSLCSSGGETNASAPSSPQSPSSSKPRKERKQRSQVEAPASPSSPSSTLSPISSSMGSVSRLSMASPTYSISSPLSHDTDHHSRDSGMASSTTLNRSYTAASAQQGDGSAYASSTFEDLPTDLTTNNYQLQPVLPMPLTQTQNQTQQFFQLKPSEALSFVPETNQSPSAVPHYMSLQLSTSTTNSPSLPNKHEQLLDQHAQYHLPQHHSPPMINQVLLEAAAIRHRDILEQPHPTPATIREEEVTQAALQIMQLRRSQNILPPMSGHAGYHLVMTEHANYDDTHEANELIEHYKRGNLVKHGMHKGYAPVPKFESSFLNNEIIVRQVEAAIAPLRSSTESPDRSSSPESDMMLMADRDVMTLPLRKRKLYMSDEANNLSSGNALEGAHVMDNKATPESTSKVMRLSSVIQFAKAS